MVSKASFNDYNGKYVIGDAPYFIAAKAQALLILRFTNAVTRYNRNASMTLKQVIDGGPTLISYEVRQIECPFPALVNPTAEPHHEIPEQAPADEPAYKPKDVLKFKREEEDDWRPSESQKPLSAAWGHESDDRVPPFIPYTRPNPAKRPEQPANTEDIGKMIERAADRNGKFRVTRGKKNEE